MEFNYNQWTPEDWYYLSRNFELWTAESFDWSEVLSLAMYCGEHIKTWWIREMIPEKWNSELVMALLINRSADFDVWWDPTIVCWWNDMVIYRLIKYRVDHFEKWWDSEKIDATKYLYLLEPYCAKYKHIWVNDDCLIYKLRQEGV